MEIKFILICVVCSITVTNAFNPVRTLYTSDNSFTNSNKFPVLTDKSREENKVELLNITVDIPKNVTPANMKVNETVNATGLVIPKELNNNATISDDKITQSGIIGDIVVQPSKHSVIQPRNTNLNATIEEKMKETTNTADNNNATETMKVKEVASQNISEPKSNIPVTLGKNESALLNATSNNTKLQAKENTMNVTQKIPVTTVNKVETNKTSKLNTASSSSNTDITFDKDVTKGVTKEPAKAPGPPKFEPSIPELVDDDFIPEEDDDVDSETVFETTNSRKEPQINAHYSYVETGAPNDENSHFFAYFASLIITVALCYAIYHNKNRILALVLEGRRDRSTSRRVSIGLNGRRRGRGGGGAKYLPLHNNLEDAMSNNDADTSSSKFEMVY